MGMTAELEVNACIFRLFQVEGLMVKQYGEDIRSVCQLRERHATTVASVVSADDANTLDIKTFVFQQPDARGREERLGILHSAEILVVAEHRQYGSIQSTELCGIISLEQRTSAAVDDVSTDEHQVGLLCIEEVNPSCKLGSAIVVSDVQVAGKDDGQGLPERLRSADRQFLAVFVSVMEIACKHDCSDNPEDSAQARSVIAKE